MADWLETALLCILAVIVGTWAIIIVILTLLIQLLYVCSPFIIIFGGLYWLFH